MGLNGSTCLATDQAEGPARPLVDGAKLEPDHEQMIDVPGGRVYARVNGALSSSAAPIVLAHGGPGSSHWYFLNATALADERPVILYDQLDCGRSERPNDASNWHVARFVAELDAIRSALGIERWHVLGTSWGAVIALEYAALFPNRVASTILSSPAISTPLWIRDAESLIASLPRESRETLEAAINGLPVAESALNAANELFESRHIIRHPVPTEVEAYRDALPIAFNWNVYRHMWGPEEYHATGTLKDYDGTALLSQVDGRKLLVVAGEFDEALPSTARRFADLAGGTFAQIDDAAHLVMSDNPEAYLSVLRPWLRTLDS